MVSDAEPVRVDIDGAVAEVVLDRPHRKNAITGPLVDGVKSALARLAVDPSVHVVLLRGEGGTFCAGLDLKEFSAEPPPAWLPGFSPSWQGLHGDIFRFPKPIVGALERAAIAGGSALALACDLLVVGRQARLHISEVEMGRPAPVNTVWLAMRLSPGAALSTLLTGPVLTGQRLFDMNLAHDVVDDDQVLPAARALAGRVAGFDPGAVRSLKAGLRAVQGVTSFEELVRRATPS